MIIDEQTFPQIYAQYTHKVRGYLYAHGIPRADIDDVAQDAWLTAWRYRDKYDPRYSLSTYIFLQARAAVSWWRRRRDSQIFHLGYRVPLMEDFPDMDVPQSMRELIYIPSDADHEWKWTEAGKVPAHNPESEDLRKHPANCKHGHAMTADNVYITPSGNRRCRKCLQDASRRSWKKTKAKRLYKS